MPNVRLSMRKIKEVLRLHAECHLSGRAIARTLSISPATVADYLRRTRVANLGWPLPEELDSESLERLLFPDVPESRIHRATIDWASVHQEIRQPGVTLQLLWEEYKARHGQDGLQYSQFCARYREWARALDLTMRQHHQAGEKLFVDYAGRTVPVINPATGEIREAQVFVAVLGASNYTYAEATWSQTIPDWVSANIRAFEFFGGVPQLVVPDNLRSGVARACRYDPDINPAFTEMARHYGTAVFPTRVRKPRDKAKVEAGVLLVERWILAALRKQQFFSLHEVNSAIKLLLIRLNQKKFKKLSGSRESVFVELDKPALLPLPAARHEVGEWKKARVGTDYHVELAGHYYSVPHALARQEVELRFNAATVEMLFHGRRVASHVRSMTSGHTTLREHMPRSHQAYLEWTPERLTAWAAKKGEHVARMVQMLRSQRDHPAQGHRACLGLMRLEHKYGSERLNAACFRALHFGTHSYKSVERILAGGHEAQPLTIPSISTGSATHENVRGGAYYAQEACHA